MLPKSTTTTLQPAPVRHHQAEDGTELRQTLLTVNRAVDCISEKLVALPVCLRQPDTGGNNSQYADFRQRRLPPAPPPPRITLSTVLAKGS